MTDSFPRQQARTQGFSLGAPRSFEISPDGSRVAFLRSQGGAVRRLRFRVPLQLLEEGRLVVAAVGQLRPVLSLGRELTRQLAVQVRG